MPFATILHVVNSLAIPVLASKSYSIFGEVFISNRGLLIPRPLMIPVAVWLIWKRPEWRLPFATALVVHGVAVLALGWAGDWGTAMLAAGEDVAIPSNVGPSRFIGTIPWLVVGLPLAVWLTWKGRVGLASLAASPYWLPYYLLMLALDWIHWRRPPWKPAR